MIILSSSTCIKIDGIAIPLNSFRIEPYAASVSLVSMSGSYRINMSIGDTTIDGVVVNSVNQLTNFLIDKGFTKGGGDGDGVTFEELDDLYGQVNIVSGSSIILDKRGFYSYTGEANINSLLPNPIEKEKTQYTIMNTTGAGKLTIIGNIFQSGGMITSFDITAGESYKVYSNGIHWIIE